MVTVTSPSGSSVASSTVATLKSADVFPAGMVTVVSPSVPDARKSLPPVASATVRLTSRPFAGAGPDAVTVNTASSPSVTGVAFVSIQARRAGVSSMMRTVTSSPFTHAEIRPEFEAFKVLPPASAVAGAAFQSRSNSSLAILELELSTSLYVAARGLSMVTPGNLLRASYLNVLRLME